MSEEIILRAENIVKSFYGNRVLNGVVVDYSNVLFMHFAIFNFADICVCVGVGLLMLVLLLDSTKKDELAQQKAEDDGTA